jgi:hypothetical protein
MLPAAISDLKPGDSGLGLECRQHRAQDGGALGLAALASLAAAQATSAHAAQASDTRRAECASPRLARGVGAPFAAAAAGLALRYACGMKTFTIELQRIKAMTNSHGLVRARVDALVQPQAGRDDGADPSSVLSLSVENARVLYLLLKAQLAEVDARKARSQR